MVRFQQLREKHRKEQLYSYENYVEGRNQNKLHERARKKIEVIEQLITAMLKKSRLHYYQVLRRKEILEDIVESNSFVYHGNFFPDTSMNMDSAPLDGFEICTEDVNTSMIMDDDERAKQNSFFSNHSKVHGLQERLSAEREKTAASTLEKKNIRLSSHRKNADRQSPSRAEARERQTGLTRLIRRKSDSSRWSGGMSRMELKTQNLVIEPYRKKKNDQRRQVDTILHDYRDRASVGSSPGSRKYKHPRTDRSASVFYTTNPNHSRAGSRFPETISPSIKMNKKKMRVRTESTDKQSHFAAESVYSNNESLNTSISGRSVGAKDKTSSLKRDSSSNPDDIKTSYQAASIANS